MKVVLKHEGCWLRFQAPEKVLTTHRTEDVLPLLIEAEQSGLYAAGFVSYEAAPAFDHALKTRPADDFPLLCLGLFRAPKVLDDIERPRSAHYVLGALEPSVSNREFIEVIGEIRDRIAEGATYQVNYTYRLRGAFSGDPWTFFHELVNGQRIEYAAYIETGDFCICSASPELFFKLTDGHIVARPMKGTARRGLTFHEDRKQSEALRASEKDRAENIMIVDMVRNDIGRVAKPGSVKTLSICDVEKYPTVWQMTSTVVGTSKEAVSDIWKALFPCASITGAPKVKTMEIIQSLETSARKIYTGSIGFITPQGNACFSVAIRTALIQNKTLEFGVGGGIVWDSDAEAEYEETLTKARILIQPRPDFRLLETMLWEPESGIFLLEEHLNRLSRSAAYFDIPLVMDEVRRALNDLSHTQPCKENRIRVLVSRDGKFEIRTSPFAPKSDRVLSVVLAKHPVDSHNCFLYHKTTHREVYESATAKCPGYDDVILFNEKGEVTESSIANVVVIRDGRKITPPIECGLLGGTFREHLLKTGEVDEEIITIRDLLKAETIYLVNSIRKWQRVTLER